MQDKNNTKRGLLHGLLVSLALVFVLTSAPQEIYNPAFSGYLQSSLVQHPVQREVVSQSPVQGKLSSEDVNQGELVSKVLLSKSPPKARSDTDYAANLRFGYKNWTDGQLLLLEPVPYQAERKSSTQVQEFLSRDSLMSTPFDTDGLSPYLQTTQQVIEEARRVHFNVFKELFKGKKYVVLTELASHENKGDPAITIAEFMMLESLNLKVIYYVDIHRCSEEYYTKALEMAQLHPQEEVILLMQGGGNIIGYPSADVCRSRGLKLFKSYQAVLLPQSIPMHSSEPHFRFAHKLYCCNPRLTMVLRDRLSLQIARRLFNNGTRLLLAPDIVFKLGPLSRSLPPLYDVIWQRRVDWERPQYQVTPESLFPANVSLWVWDWLTMKSLPGDTPLLTARNVLDNGLAILQKGRVVVTDRLHGHILSTLLDIPHVLLDNPDNKLSSYHNTWTRGLANCRLAGNVQDAARLAMELLDTYRDALPARLTAADIPQ